MSIYCPQCGHANRDTARFCARCRAALSPPAPPAAPQHGLGTGMLPPRSLLAGRYIILRRVGQGGMGAVYQAADTRIAGKMWAVKEMSDAAITDPLEKQQAIAAFQQEARLLSCLNHPGIPRVVDFFSEGGKQYLVMEFVEGQTLEEMLAQRRGPFSEQEVYPWLMQLCDVLHYLHSQSPPVIFRDLKPANIMVDRSGQIKLIDFGIARLFKRGKKGDTVVMGTPGYAAPEQFGRRQTDPRSDIYALGVTLYRLLTAYDPGTTPLHLPPLRQLCPGISDTMEQVIQRAIQPRSAQRWQSAVEIRQFIGGGPISPPVEPTAVVPPAAKPPVRPTTRLLLAMAEMSPQQLALIIGGLVVAMAALTWLFTPFVSENLPWVWLNVPLFMIAGPAVYLASQRRGTALFAHSVVTIIVRLVMDWRIASTSIDIGTLIAATLVSGAVLEGGFWLRRRETAEVWWQDCLWAMGTTALGMITFMIVGLNEPGLVGGFRLGPIVGATLVGALAWFLGDSVQQWFVLKQTGIRRRYGKT